jgi:uncharacterized protein
MYFQIEGSNVRLGGTVQRVPKGWSLAAWVADAIGWAGSIYLEHEHDPLTLDRLSRLSGEQPIEQRLPRSWHYVTAELPSFAAHKPGFIAMQILAAVPSDPGVDKMVYESARNERTRIGYLETLTELSGLLDTVPDAAWDEALIWLLKNHDVPKKIMVEQYSAWIEANIGAAESVTHHGLMQFTEIRDKMVAFRNSRWLPSILGLINSAQGPTLILVGADQMGGQGGLVPQLRASGLKLTPLA